MIKRLNIRTDEMGEAIKSHLESTDSQVRRAIRMHVAHKEFVDVEGVQDMRRRLAVFNLRVHEHVIAILGNQESRAYANIVSQFVKAASERVRWLVARKFMQTEEDSDGDLVSSTATPLATQKYPM